MNEKSNVSETDSHSDSGSDSDVWLSQTIQLGRHRGRTFSIGPSRTPEGARAPDEFGANVFTQTGDGENVDIVRVDTAHDGCHVDRLYLPEEHPDRRDYSLTFFSPEGVFEWLTEDELWREFVDVYDENHGLPPTAVEKHEE